jgi:hypothetical protein
MRRGTSEKVRAAAWGAVTTAVLAISTLAGTMLLIQSSRSPLLTDLAPFVKGMTLLFWSTATWWIPMLVILGVWRHGYRRFALRYDPLYWGAVFPWACTRPVRSALPK